MLNETDTFFKMLADSTRLRCLLLMQAEGELCVCELTHALNLSQPKISRHLAHLREAGVLVARRNGTWMNYRINPDLQGWALGILQTTLDGYATPNPLFQTKKYSIKWLIGRSKRVVPKWIFMNKPFNVILMHRQFLPLNEIIEQFRANHDDIKSRVKELLQRINTKSI